MLFTRSFQRFESFSSVVACCLIVAIAVANGSVASAQESASPTKERLIEVLTKVAEQIEQKKYEETRPYFYLPDDFETRMFEQLGSRKVINSPGVKALAAGGVFGEAFDITRKSKVESACKEFNVPVEECYVAKMRQGDDECIVIAHWTGTQFKILDINGVGGMDPANVVVLKDLPDQPWPTGESPSKELMLSTLKVFLHKIENRHFKTLRPKVYVPEDFEMSRFHDFLERQEISAKGIEVLASKGQFAKADEVFPKLRVEILAKRVQVPPAECYGYVAKVGMEQGEVLAHWVGDHFKLLRTDDVGKLPAALEATMLSANSPAKVTAVPEAKPVSATEPPKGKVDPASAMENYLALQQSVAQNPKDVLLRAQFVDSLLAIGNSPKAWEEAREIYAMDPTNAKVVGAVDQCIEGFRKNGIFQKGVASQTFEALMGAPLSKSSEGAVERWKYPVWHIDFNQGTFVKMARDEVASKETEGAAQVPAKSDAPQAATTVADSLFDVKLISFERKVSAISWLTAEQGMGLKDAVKLVGDLPVVVLKGLTREDAEKAKARMTEKKMVAEIVDAEATPVETK